MLFSRFAIRRFGKYKNWKKFKLTKTIIHMPNKNCSINIRKTTGSLEQTGFKNQLLRKTY
jgi:hypothetical protein